MGLKQYEIVLVNLDPTKGSEIKKTRPVVIISPDEMNDNLRTVIVASMTSTSKNYPSRVKVKHSNKEGWIVLDQIRTIDKSRILNSLGELNKKESSTLKEVIREMLVD